MRVSAKLQVLICLMVYVSSAHAIMVKFGTKDGPIEPPTPEPLPSPQPYRDPAPVWEQRTNDTPDPNAQWRPPLFVPQRKYTNIVYKPAATTPPALNNAQRFVLAYKPVNKPVTGPSQEHPVVLSSQNLPGEGLRYFYPINKKEQQKPAKQEDAKNNYIDADVEASDESAHEFQWKYEKEATRRSIRNNREATAVSPGFPVYQVYQWPIYVQPRHH